MSLSRALRMTRWTPVAAILLGAACTHGDANKLVTVGGDTLILNVSLNPAGLALPSGTRLVNQYLVAGFDTSVADAFSRATTLPASWYDDPTCYGTFLIRPSGPAKVATYTPPQVYLPAMPYRLRMVDACGGGQSTNLIAEKGNAGNGAGNQVWEFWYNMDGGGPTGRRFVMGVARYAVQVRGALDISEMLLTGKVTQPDTLVFRTGDFAPAGKKRRDAFTTNCASVNVVHPIAGANPHLLGSDTSRSGALDLDQTVCAAAGEAWSDLGTATSPIPTNNNTALGANQYNFFVIWEALPDSTPDYAKPVFREQVGPLLTTAGLVVNNSYGPFPAAKLTPTQVFASPGGTAAFLAADTVSVTISNLAPLAAGSRYEVYLAQTGTANAKSVTGRMDHIIGGAITDSNLTATNFDGDARLGVTTKFTFDYANYVALGNWNSLVVAVGTGSGGTALPAVQPLWSAFSGKVLAGQPSPTLSQGLTFGSFDGGGAPVRWAATGTAAGGITGREIGAQPVHLLRPPVGYFYSAYLYNSTDSTVLDLGPITSPYPDYASLVDADVTVGGAVNTVEIVQSALRWTDESTISDTVLTGRTNLGDFGTGTTVPATWNTTVCQYDQIQVRLAPKSGASGVVPPTVAIKGSNPRVASTYCTKPAAQ